MDWAAEQPEPPPPHVPSQGVALPPGCQHLPAPAWSPTMLPGAGLGYSLSGTGALPHPWGLPLWRLRHGSRSLKPSSRRPPRPGSQSLRGPAGAAPRPCRLPARPGGRHWRLFCCLTQSHAAEAGQEGRVSGRQELPDRPPRRWGCLRPLPWAGRDLPLPGPSQAPPRWPGPGQAALPLPASVSSPPTHGAPTLGMG